MPKSDKVCPETVRLEYTKVITVSVDNPIKFKAAYEEHCDYGGSGFILEYEMEAIVNHFVMMDEQTNGDLYYDPTLGQFKTTSNNQGGRRFSIADSKQIEISGDVEIHESWLSKGESNA